MAVQGLGAHAFYTWVRKVPAAQTTARTKEKTRVKTFSRLFAKKGRSPDDHGGCTTTEVMWPRDLLAPAFSNARVATYSYGSDWRDRQVNTSLRECGQQLLEVLLQHRQDESVRQCAPHLLRMLGRLQPFHCLTRTTGTTATARPNRPQPRRACHPAGKEHNSDSARKKHSLTQARRLLLLSMDPATPIFVSLSQASSSWARRSRAAERQHTRSGWRSSSGCRRPRATGTRC